MYSLCALATRHICTLPDQPSLELRPTFLQSPHQRFSHRQSRSPYQNQASILEFITPRQRPMALKVPRTRCMLQPFLTPIRNRARVSSRSGIFWPQLCLLCSRSDQDEQRGAGNVDNRCSWTRCAIPEKAFPVYLCHQIGKTTPLDPSDPNADMLDLTVLARDFVNLISTLFPNPAEAPSLIVCPLL